jgi:predicted RND superfamily exporter protein
MDSKTPNAFQIGGAALGGATSVLGGISESNSLKSQAKQYKQQARLIRLAGKQDEVQRRQGLADILAAQQAIRSASGVDPYSQTSQNIAKRTSFEGESDILTSRINYLSQERQARLAAKEAKRAAKKSLFGGILSGATSLAGPFLGGL